MCLPILGAVVGAAGSIFSGMAAASAANAQAAQEKAQARALNMQAIAQGNAGAYESGIKQDEGKRLIGQQVTALAANGVDITSGTPGDIITDSASNINMDVAAIRKNWQEKIRLSGYEANVHLMNAKIAKQNAKMAMIGGAIGALSPLVSGFQNTSTTTSFG